MNLRTPMPNDDVKRSVCRNCGQRIYQPGEDTPWYHDGGQGRCITTYAAPVES